MDSSDYIRFDTELDAVSSIELAVEFLALSKQDDRYWKWFVIAFHGGMQGLFALALKNGDGLLVQKPETTKRMLKALNEGTPYPTAFMDGFVQLYKKTTNPASLRPGSTPLPSNEEHKAAIERLNSLRNEFIHFNDKSWSIERSYLLRDTLILCDVADHIREQSGTIIWHDDEIPDRLNKALQQLRELSQGQAE